MSEGLPVSALVVGAAAIGGFVWWSRAQARADVVEAALRARGEVREELRHEQRLQGRPQSADAPADPISATSPLVLPALGPDGRPSRYRFDAIFTGLGRGIPVAYLRALAQAESGLNPDDPKGLINVVPIALRHYNQHHPEAPITSAQLRDPVASVTVAVHVLRTIIASYAKNHPQVANLREDWNNPRFVELLTAGWNAGFSEASGVGRVVRHLLARGVTEITVDRVFAAAPAAGASATLANAAKLAFARTVTAAYLREAHA